MLVYEIDNYPKEKQFGLWEKAGLPAPTLALAGSLFSRIAAISEAFKIVNTNVLEAEQRKQLQAIRAHLDSLEDG